jgi:L-asparaginase
MAKEIVFLGMGGTIAGTAQLASDNVGYTAAQIGVQHLLDTLPGLQAVLGGQQVRSEQVCQIDSKDLAHGDWLVLLDRLTHYLAMPDVSGVVVTHGTDTLEETAYFLSRAIPAALLAHKPVVLTCAMRPSSALAPDGPGNMVDAASVALCDGAHGVLMVCAGKVHAAVQVQKVHPYRVDAFDSGESSPIGLVEEGRVRLLSDWPQADVTQAPAPIANLRAHGWPRVELLVSHAGASGALVRALLQDMGGDDPVRGLVVAGTGNGTIHRDMEVALLAAMAQGVRVLRVSRCAYGQIVGASEAARSGAFAAAALPAVKARIALMLDIAAEQ